MLNIRDLGRIVDGCPDSSMVAKKEYMKVSYNGEKILELKDNCIRIRPDMYNKLDKYMIKYIELACTVDTVEETVLDNVSDGSLVKGGLIAVGTAVVVAGAIILTKKYVVPAAKKLICKGKDDAAVDAEVNSVDTESK